MSLWSLSLWLCGGNNTSPSAKTTAEAQPFSEQVGARTHTYTLTWLHFDNLYTPLHYRRPHSQFALFSLRRGRCFPSFLTLFPLIPPKNQSAARRRWCGTHPLQFFFPSSFFFRHARNDVTAGKIANPSPTPNSPISAIVDGTWNRARRRVARLKRRG